MDKNDNNAPQKRNILNDFDTNESKFAECAPHTEETHHFRNEFCAQHDSCIHHHIDGCFSFCLFQCRIKFYLKNTKYF